MLLQRRAPGRFRRHFLRAITRVVVLSGADIGAFLAVRSTIRLVRDGGILGDGVASVARQVLPLGYLGGLEFAAALWLGLLVAGTYGRGDCRKDVGCLFLGVSMAGALVLWQSIWDVGLLTVALQFALTTVGLWATIALERLIIDWSVVRFLPRRHGAERVLFVGDEHDPTGARVYSRLTGNGSMMPLGWVYGSNGGPEAKVGGNGDGRLGVVADIWNILHETEADTVVLCGELPNDSFQRVVEAATVAGCQVLSVSRFDGVARQRAGLVWHRGIPFVELTVPALKARQLLIKRVIDVIGSVLGLVVLSPLFAAIAMVVKMGSRGPVFFSHERVGYGGRIFRLLKFRTMRDGADDEKESVAHLNHTGDPRLFKIPDDPRVTPVGAWLRRWSLDELPQLWNVLVGTMSLVGPRPFFEADLADYSDRHFTRLGAKPGITGLWQVEGRSAVVDFEEVVRLDREYIDRWSLWLDLRILVQTLPAVMKRTGAY